MSSPSAQSRAARPQEMMWYSRMMLREEQTGAAEGGGVHRRVPHPRALPPARTAARARAPGTRALCCL